MNECAVCYQVISLNRSLCEACEADRLAELTKAGDAERIFKERQARAMIVE